MAVEDAALCATRCADILWANDSASRELGITLEAVGPGEALCSLLVQQRHCNGHGICHGGFIFTLADTAFAFACNSYNQYCVAQHNTITYIVAAHLGDHLKATAKEVSRSGRSGIYDVAIDNQEGVQVAEFRGCSRTIKGQFFQAE